MLVAVLVVVAVGCVAVVYCNHLSLEAVAVAAVVVVVVVLLLLGGSVV